jgi:RNA polymerase sigma-70 factor, ECF subfamily
MDSQGAERFALLWVGAQGPLTAFVRSLVPDFQQAEEVLQRVATALVRKFDRYDSNRSFAAWAIGMAKYEVLYFRRERATDRHVFNDEIVDSIALSYQMLVEEADPYRDALQRCVEGLEGRAKRVVELRYGKGLTSPVVAREMRLSAGAVRMLLSRVRQSLRECIEQRLDDHAPT